MSAFRSGNMFEQHTYDMNYDMNDMNTTAPTEAFHPDASSIFMPNSSASAHEQRGYPPSTTSSSPSYSHSLQPCTSTMSHASVSGTSTTSSAIGSPFMTMHQESEHFEDWSKTQWGIVDSNVVQSEDGYFSTSMEDDKGMQFVAPSSIVSPEMEYPSFMGPSTNLAFDGSIPDFKPQFPHSTFPMPSPVPTTNSSYESSSVSVMTPSASHTVSNQASANGLSRRPSAGSIGSGLSRGSPKSMTAGFEEEGNERGRCNYPGCGRVFKDLRAHKLTHQSERPEKCPIEKCQYHIKGFARKYDQTRHTLTHYKGTMVCGFCPGSGSAGEKSFNRADVFKRHLTSVHGVEQTPSNSRRKSPSVTKKAPSKDENKEGKCSTCGSVFSSAQEFYNHLDDCVMKILEKPELSETHNERHLLEVSNDQAVKATLERQNLPTEVEDETMPASENEEEEMDDEDDDELTEQKGSTPVNRMSKAGRGLTRSKGGVPTISKGRRKRKDYPHSWGCGKDQMKMQKRVLCVFDGQRRLWKDEMMMDHDFEVRVAYGENKYVTDLDVMTMKKADALHRATAEEKGAWLNDDEVTKLML